LIWPTSLIQPLKLKSYNVTTPSPLTDYTATPYQLNIAVNAAKTSRRRGALPFPAARHALNAKALSN